MSVDLKPTISPWRMGNFVQHISPAQSPMAWRSPKKLFHWFCALVS